MRILKNFTRRILSLLFRKKKEIYVVDVKTGKDIYDTSFLQGAAYKNALEEEGIKVKGIGVILLQTGSDGEPTGRYKYEQGEDCFNEFLACQKLWYWRNKDICEKVGYKLPWGGGEKV